MKPRKDRADAREGAASVRWAYGCRGERTARPVGWHSRSAAPPRCCTRLPPCTSPPHRATVRTPSSTSSALRLRTPHFASTPGVLPFHEDTIFDFLRPASLKVEAEGPRAGTQQPRGLAPDVPSSHVWMATPVTPARRPCRARRLLLLARRRRPSSRCARSPWDYGAGSEAKLSRCGLPATDTCIGKAYFGMEKEEQARGTDADGKKNAGLPPDENFGGRKRSVTKKKEAEILPL